MLHPRRAFAVLGAALLMLWLPAGAAWAHEDRAIGDLSMIVGFGDEPAYAGLPNSVEVVLTRGNAPVTDLGPGDLRAEITFGDASTRMDLEPNFVPGVYGEPGDYRAWFVPSQPGPYTFRVVGAVGHEQVDESFTSGPNTFSEAGDLAGAAFPPIDAPSNDELATRIEQEASRSADALAASERAAADARDQASGAQTFAVVAFIVGALGLVAGLGGIAFARTKV